MLRGYALGTDENGLPATREYLISAVLSNTYALIRACRCPLLTSSAVMESEGALTDFP